MLTSSRADARELSLFQNADTIETGTPDAQAWLAHDPHSGSPVMIKRLKGIGAKARATEALSLKHPQLITPRRWLVAEGSLYVIRDIARGKNLTKFLEPMHGKPGTAQLQRLLTPVVDALEVAHTQRVAHGGISPENILITENDVPVLVDFATTDPTSPQHVKSYSGTASIEGDIRALGKLIASLLPTTERFANPVARTRVESILLRCTTLEDLRKTLETLENIALSTPASGRKTIAVPPPTPKDPPKTSEAQVAKLLCEPGAEYTSVMPGGGGVATMTLRNDGEGTLYVRMIATQHAWLNVRPMPLPLSLAPGKATQVTFVISAARLAPGEYRSAVYFSANALSPQAEDTHNGWYRHSAEIRISVGGVSGWRR